MDRRTFAPLRCACLALVITLAQIGMAVISIAPEGPLGYRYTTLVQHDSYWFANIVNRGFNTTVPPIGHKMMEVSNVAFFPAYPLLASGVQHLFHLSTENALLLTAQAAAFGFWTYFFLFGERWNLSAPLQFFGALAIACHPAAFFLVAGYSESLFLAALVGFVYWNGAEGRMAKVLAAAHGLMMSATRIVGVPCAAFPVVQSFFAKRWKGFGNLKAWLRSLLPAIVLMCFATLGALVFFAYCQFRWGRWDMYMLTQQAGWAIFPDYLAVFKGRSYHWLIPALDDPSQASQLTMTLTAVLFGVVAILEAVPAVRRHTNWQVRIGMYFCAVVIYYISVSGVASVEMESMLRYSFCVHALIVLALLHYLRQFRATPVLVRAFGMVTVALVAAAGLALQGWYVWNFTRGNWVA